MATALVEDPNDLMSSFVILEFGNLDCSMSNTPHDLHHTPETVVLPK